MLDASTLCRFVDSMLFYLVISAKSSVLLSRPPSKNTSRALAKTSLGKTLISVLDFGEERRTEIINLNPFWEDYLTITVTSLAA